MGGFQTRVKRKTKDFQIVHIILSKYRRTSACDFNCNTTLYTYLYYRDDISIIIRNHSVIYIFYLTQYLLR